MGQRHSELMIGYFPKQHATGIDLENVELKECNNPHHKYTIKKKDLKAEFILFYDWMDDEYFFVNTKEMPIIKRKKRETNPECKRSITTTQVRKIAYLATKDQDIFMDEMEAIVKDKTHLAWLIPSNATNPTNPELIAKSTSTIETDSIGEPTHT